LKFVAIYRASFYLMLTFATLVLRIDATDDNPLAMAYPPVMAIACFIAYVTVDRNPKLALSRTLASLLALSSGILSWFEYEYDNNLLLLATAHWLVYLTLIKLFLPKTVEDDWFLFLLGLVQVLVGGVMSQSDNEGLALFCWSLLSLWVLSLFALHRESLRMAKVPMAAQTLEGDRSEPYSGLVDTPFLFSSARVAATTLAMGGLIFLAMPRRASMGTSQSSGTVGKHLTGFDDEVQLGQLGEILENDSVVMSVELYNSDGSRIANAAEQDFLWRGVTMDRYDKGRWRRPRPRSGTFPMGVPGTGRDGPVIRQVIKLEPTDSPILFALRPIVYSDTANRRLTPELNTKDGSLFRSDSSTAAFDYTIESSTDPKIPQPGESVPDRLYEFELRSMDSKLKAKLRPIAEAQVKGIDPKDREARVTAIEHYLRDSGEFRYSLQQEVTNPDLDPVEDFLINHKTGHCEYFASALTLLLRSIDIPARMVNGFRGGDFNGLAGVVTVRQKHAHSWVEAYLGPTTDLLTRPIWRTLDPTPGDQLDASVAQVGGLANNFHQVTDLVRYVWIFYIVGFNSERQERFLYKPIKDLIAEAQRGFALIGKTLGEWLHFPSAGSFFSLRGFVVSFVALLILVGLYRLGRWIVLRWVARWRGVEAAGAGAAVGIHFYRRLQQLLGEYGLDRPPAETPREFARRASVFLSGHGSGTEAVADVPPLVVEAFYRIRFGEHTLGDEDLEHVVARLDALESGLHPPKS
jgi:transglutaminase-like putative cysteine protease